MREFYFESKWIRCRLGKAMCDLIDLSPNEHNFVIGDTIPPNSFGMIEELMSFTTQLLSLSNIT